MPYDVSTRTRNGRTFGGVFVLPDGPSVLGWEFEPTTVQARAVAEALNIHEQTGLTPAQLQARVAELEGALSDLLYWDNGKSEYAHARKLLGLPVCGDD